MLRIMLWMARFFLLNFTCKENFNILQLAIANLVLDLLICFYMFCILSANI